MDRLTDSGRQVVFSLAAQHGFSPDAVTHLLLAVAAGGGTMAQFSHPEFGGSGQWMRGGMLMLGDMFNHALKGRVDALCMALSDRLAAGDALIARSTAPGAAAWWPPELGQPAASGAQNAMRYAWFPGPRRLAVDSGGDVWVYDTLDHQIGGFAQQQGGSSGISLSSQYGTVSLATLPVVMRGGQPVMPPAAPAPVPASVAPTFAPPAPPLMPTSAPEGGADAILATIERLGDLLARGLLTEQEFAAKKAELLGRL
jgi:hypothetical protein